MKKLYTLVTLLMLSMSSAFAQSSDLAILHNVQTGDTITVSSTPPTYIFSYGFANYGPDPLTQSDTIYLRTTYQQGYYVLTLPSTGLPVNDTVYFNDTIAFSGSTNQSGNIQWCDSIFAKNAGGIIGDTLMTNNKICHTVYLNNETLSIGGNEFTTSRGISTKGLNVYPNPATTTVGFDYYSNSYTEAYLLVSDITGRKIHQQNLGKVQGAQKANIAVSDFSNGLYIVELRVGDAKQVGKFFIQK